MSEQAQPTSALQRTPLHDRHAALGARMVDFGGWEMPVQYPAGIIAEHLATRRAAGLFDVSHMGRFTLRGAGAVTFLQHVLTNNAEALDPLQAQYTIVPTPAGGAVDDAYLYRFDEAEYLLVVNASNRIKDWGHFLGHLAAFPDVGLIDETSEIAMLALQGKQARGILAGLIETGGLPEPFRNELSIATLRVPDPGGGAAIAVRTRIGRTGYTGEPLCFELFIAAEQGPALWDALVAAGAAPVGLGARDTLRLEAGLPLYGHELGLDPEGHEIPIMSCPLATFAVSFSPRKGMFVGRAALERQHAAYARIISRDYSLIADLPRLTRPLAVTGRGIAREGAPVSRPGDGDSLGWVTSGTAVPYWGVEGEGLCSTQTEGHELRSIALAYIDSRVLEDDELEVDVRGRRVPGLVVPYHLRSDAPPCARAIVWDHVPQLAELAGGEAGEKALRLLAGAIDNHTWRQDRCIDLIPSEMTASPMARLLSIMDPSFRYAEHKKTEAFYDLEVFYYQGTGFIHEVERLLAGELRAYLGCPEVETRVISGQMANTAVFSALVDYLNRADRKTEPRRIGKVINNHIARGGHLSAQPMGALRDYVARDPRTEMPAVVDIPVLAENPYKADVPALLDLVEKERPELIILGKSMVLHPEPVYEVRTFLDAAGIDAVLMYDMAHVLGLVGPHFQEPFNEGADIVTGSTHKTFFGTQRGLIGGRWQEPEQKWDLWETIERRAFPGSVSNHHLGSLLGLLMATFEMNHFKDAFQSAVIRNAKAFAVALKEAGLDVAGDPAIDYTETHQVIVNVGYGHGAELAGRLEDNNIICNYQAVPDEEGFTASGALRLGVAEMTRFGMSPADFAEVAALIAAVVSDDRAVAADVAALRSRFTELGYCFQGPDFDPFVQRLHELV
ncbi:MAG: glycine cleavage system aminomethyltransferase GcvT [Actinobacteria bacterium]|nr:glycine cleavage system aminomethyltransferase GcvT [Actinomycetota bacterium]